MDNTGNQTTPLSQGVASPVQPGKESGIPPSTPSNFGNVPEEFEEETSSPWKKILLIVGGIFGALVIFLTIFLIILHIRASQSQKITLVYWGVWEDGSVFQPVFNGFEKLHPNVTVQYEQQDIKGLGKYVNRITARIGNGTGPDIFRYHNSWLPELKNVLLPLPTSVISSVGLDTQFYQITDPLGFGNAKVYYGVPLEIDNLCLFVNNSQIKSSSIPQTWDDFLTAARHYTVTDAATGKIVTSGAAFGTYDNVAHASDIISLLMLQNGANFTDLAGSGRQNADQALSYYTSFATNDLNSPTVERKTWDSSMEYSTLAFAKGKVAMYFGYSWDILEIKAVNPQLDFSIYPVPHVSGGGKSTIASFWQEGISSKTKHPKEAFELLSYMAQKENLEKIFEQQSKVRVVGSPYPRRDMADLLKSNTMLFPFVSQLLQNGEVIYSTPFSSDTHDDYLDDNLNAGLQAEIGKIVNSSFSVDSAVGEIAGNLKNVGIGK